MFIPPKKPNQPAASPELNSPTPPTNPEASTPTEQSLPQESLPQLNPISEGGAAPESSATTPPDSDIPPPRFDPEKRLPLTPANFLFGLDVFIALGALCLAFLVSSFLVYNTDFYRHIASGRLLANGEYSFGKDPFSYMTEGRTWVNHSWLYDYVLYLAYQSEAKADGISTGRNVVILKSLLVAVAGLLLLFARPKNSTLLPAAIALIGAILISASRLLLQPMIVSIFFLSLYLFLMVRIYPSLSLKQDRPKAIGFLVGIGIGSWLWASSDQWFFLGPTLIGLYLLGTYLSQKFNPSPSEENAPDLKLGLLAFGISFLGSSLTPHHFLVWTVQPIELTGLAVLKTDADFKGLLAPSWITDTSVLFAGTRHSIFHYPAMITLLLLAALSFVLQPRKVNWSLLLCWLPLLILGLAVARTMPLLAVVTTVVIGTNFGVWAYNMASQTYRIGMRNAIHASRTLLRGLMVLGVIFLVLYSYPGRLHPQDRTITRRVEFRVMLEPSLHKTALALQEKRVTGTLPAEARGIALQPDLAHYCAWFAPNEKYYVDTRFQLYSQETLKNYFTLRQFFNPSSETFNAILDKANSPDALLQKENISYLASATNLVYFTIKMLDFGWARENPNDAWELMHLAGRGAVIINPKSSALAGKPNIDSLYFDPFKAAYQSPELLPEPVYKPFNPDKTFWDRLVQEYVEPTVIPDGSAEEVVLWNRYLDYLQFTNARKAVQLWGLRFLGGPIDAIGLTTIRPTVGVNPNQTANFPIRAVPRFEPNMAKPAAVALLRVRAARRAVIQNPEVTANHIELARAYADSSFLTVESSREALVARETARTAARLVPNPDRRDLDLPASAFVAELACNNFLQKNRGDLALIMANMLVNYNERLANTRAVGNLSEKEIKQQLDYFKNQRDALKKQVDQTRVSYTTLVNNIKSPLARAYAAREKGLEIDALRELIKGLVGLNFLSLDLRDKPTKDVALPKVTITGKPLNPTGADLALVFEVIDSLLIMGYFEIATELIFGLGDDVWKEAFDSRDEKKGPRAYLEAFRTAAAQRPLPFPSNSIPPPKARLQNFRSQVALVTGDFKTLIELQLEQKQVPPLELLAFGESIQTSPETAQAIQRTMSVLNFEIPNLNLQIKSLIGLGNLLAGPFETANGILYSIQIERYMAYVNTIVAESSQKLSLGVLYLEAGDIRLAEQQLRGVLDTRGLKIETQSQQIARAYLEGIDRAQKK